MKLLGLLIIKFLFFGISYIILSIILIIELFIYFISLGKIVSKFGDIYTTKCVKLLQIISDIEFDIINKK